MTGSMRIVEDDAEVWLEMYDHPENYPWKQVGAKGLTIKTDYGRVPAWREVLVCHVGEAKYGEYIVKLHNDALAAKLQKGAGI
jgi:hypothetical protein